jgi:hypothetical protein
MPAFLKAFEAKTLISTDMSVTFVTPFFRLETDFPLYIIFLLKPLRLFHYRLP